MLKALSRLGLGPQLGLLAIGLGAVALFAKVHPGRTITVHEKELLTAVERREDHVRPSELVAWIIEGRGDYRLVDIRDPQAYAQYHIPTAESIPLATLADGLLGRTEKVVLYGDGGIHAAQGWMVLRGKGHTAVYTLLEGLDAWKDQVLFPVAPASPTAEEQARFERAVQVARFFGGQPRAAATADGASAALPVPLPSPPAVVAPMLPSGVGAAAPPRKKKEGC